MPNIRDRFPLSDNPKVPPIEIAELSAHLRTAILKMNGPELATFTDALAAAFLGNEDMRRMARFITNDRNLDQMPLFGGERDA